MNSDRVHISNHGSDRSRSAKQNEFTFNGDKNGPVETRLERFKDVRSALESGVYWVPAKDLAQKLIAANTK